MFSYIILTSIRYMNVDETIVTLENAHLVPILALKNDFSSFTLTWKWLYKNSPVDIDLWLSGQKKRKGLGVRGCWHEWWFPDWISYLWQHLPWCVWHKSRGDIHHKKPPKKLSTSELRLSLGLQPREGWYIQNGTQSVLSFRYLAPRRPSRVLWRVGRRLRLTERYNQHHLWEERRG